MAFHEDKQKICSALAEALKLTRVGTNIAAIEYDPKSETAKVIFRSGAHRLINVACDSGAAMIRDIMNYI